MKRIVRGSAASSPASCRCPLRALRSSPCAPHQCAPHPLHPAFLPTPQSRVLHGVRPEILALSEIPFVKAYTARLLYRAGLR